MWRPRAPPPPASVLGRADAQTEAQRGGAGRRRTTRSRCQGHPVQPFRCSGVVPGGGARARAPGGGTGAVLASAVGAVATTRTEVAHRVERSLFVGVCDYICITRLFWVSTVTIVHCPSLACRVFLIKTFSHLRQNPLLQKARVLLAGHRFRGRWAHAVRRPSHTSVRPNTCSYGTCLRDTTQQPAKPASCSERKATSSGGSARAQLRTAAVHSASAAGGIHAQTGEPPLSVVP